MPWAGLGWGFVSWIGDRTVPADQSVTAGNRKGPWMGRERRSEGTLTVEVELEPVGEDVCCGDVELQGHVFHNALKAPRHQEHLDPSLVQPAHQLPERRQHKAQINPSQTKLGAIPVQFWCVLLPAPSTSAVQNFSFFLCAHLAGKCWTKPSFHSSKTSSPSNSFLSTFTLVPFLSH